MKQFVIFLIGVYQALVSPFLHHFGIGGCRYAPSCSVYTKQMVEKYGAIKGVVLGARRLFTCHPFAKEATNTI